MAFRRRRRRQRVQWFPPIGARLTIDQNTLPIGGNTILINLTQLGEVHTEIPLTYDASQANIVDLAQAAFTTAPNTPTTTLADIMGEGWRCRRIIGSLYLTRSLNGIANRDIVAGQHPAVLVGAGLMVRQVGDAGLLPLGDESPLLVPDYTDPWIWRRTWVLGMGANPSRNNINNVQAFAGFAPSDLVGSQDRDVAFANFPHSTTGYAALGEGGHIDQKTNRVIGPEDRLFLHLAVKGLPLTFAATSLGAIVGFFDFRLLGMQFKSTNRRNASRP